MKRGAEDDGKSPRTSREPAVAMRKRCLRYLTDLDSDDLIRR
jgi:hypothetical protein